MEYKVKMQSKVDENPFYGKVALKSLLNSGKTASTKSAMFDLLNKAWQECTTRELREGFFVIIFSIGEITNRQHNIFGKIKVDNGGEAARIQFMWAMSWLRKNNAVQYYKFMFAGIINQFVSWFVLLSSQVRTIKGKSTIDKDNTDAYNSLAEHDVEKLANYLATVLTKGSIID